MTIREAYYDPTTCVSLGPGWMAAELVFPDGTREPWIINLHATPQDHEGCACANCAPHEQLAAAS